VQRFFTGKECSLFLQLSESELVASIQLLFIVCSRGIRFIHTHKGCIYTSRMADEAFSHINFLTSLFMALQATTGLSVPGMPSQAVLQGLSALTRPMTQQQQQPYLPTSSQEPSASSTSTHQGLGPSPGKLQMQMELPDDVALKMAIDASLRTATEEGLQLSAAGELTNVQDRRHGESSDSRTRMSPPENAAAKFGGWGVDEKQQSGYNGWSSSNEEAGPSRGQDFAGKQSKQPDSESKVKPEDSPVAEATASDVLLHAPGTTSAALPSPPSAPPLPADYAALENSDNVGAIHYPPVDTSPAQVDLAAVAPSNEKVAAAAATASSQDGANQCVVCWDAPAQGVCIPCGHLAGCMSCLSEIKAKNWGCPVCRAPIDQVIRVYAV
jgi:hypothetical protein